MDDTLALRGEAILLPFASVQLVQRDGETPRWVRVTEPSGEIMVEQVALVLTANVLAAIEERWESTEKWLAAIEQQPYRTTRDTIALALGRPSEAVGEAMLRTHMHTYTAALGAAYAIANGLDPTEAVKALEVVVATADPTKRLSELVTRGDPGSRHGSVSPDVTTTSSGG